MLVREIQRKKENIVINNEKFLKKVYFCKEKIKQK